jgi:hypothetical protein
LLVVCHSHLLDIRPGHWQVHFAIGHRLCAASSSSRCRRGQTQGGRGGGSGRSSCLAATIRIGSSIVVIVVVGCDCDCRERRRQEAFLVQGFLMGNPSAKSSFPLKVFFLFHLPADTLLSHFELRAFAGSLFAQKRLTRTQMWCIVNIPPLFIVQWGTMGDAAAAENNAK